MSAHARGRQAYNFAKTATDRQMRTESVLADEVGGEYRQGFLDAKNEDSAVCTYVHPGSAIRRLRPSQRVSIDVETFEGKSSCYATLYDRDLETGENEEGFVAATEVLGATSIDEILLKLFEDPDVTNG